MIEVTDEMKAAFYAAQELRAQELVAEGAPLGAHDILDRGLAAVLAIVERDNHVSRRPTVEDVAAWPKPRRRLRACVERWPGAEIDGDYDPRCCRFPKSCSATVYSDDVVTEADLEPDRG